MNQSKLFELDNLSLETAAPEAIPIIDFAPFIDGVSPSIVSCPLKDKTAEELVYAFSKSGFVYLKNHGISEEEINDMFLLSKHYFAKDLKEKESLGWETAEANRGYVGLGKEKLSDLDKEGRAEDIVALNQISPDLKEAFDIGLDHPDIPYKNKYPSKEFGDKSDAFFKRMQNLNVKMMTAIAIGLGLEHDFFQSAIKLGTNTLRLLHYPKCPPSEINDFSRRCGAHTDYGSVTFLFQDSVGGLEVLDRSKNEFVRAVPIPGTIVVNVGDLLQRWTNDYLTSNQHRVVKPYSVGEDGFLPARYSIAYFCDPDSDTKVETIPKFITEKNPNKYEPVTAGEHLLARLNNTYV
ncbi:hypothetical protein BDR26DRAFT_863305 [Obelidium mucronatum]|nr:hypothetical protein BDR26DRAFT_863305 [Obelidium mucronatum]